MLGYLVVRRNIALLLLLAAAFHPLAHMADELVVCPCVHAGETRVQPLFVEAPVTAAAAHVAYLSVSLPSRDSGPLPARAPPAAA